VLLEVALCTGRSPRGAARLIRAVYAGIELAAPELAARLRDGMSAEVLDLVGVARRSHWVRELPLRARPVENLARRVSPKQPADR
jgi:hypothetical protein